MSFNSYFQNISNVYLINPPDMHPLQKEPFDDQTTTVFFDTLLPLEVARKRLGKILQLSRHNVFDFLKAIDGDCTGAVFLYPAETETSNENPTSLRELSCEDAVEFLTQLPKRPLNLGRNAGFRISGTGAQDKLIDCVKDAAFVRGTINLYHQVANCRIS